MATATGRTDIDARSPVPKYYQLREILLDLIERELAVDAPVPSERELAARYGLSRMTARQAVEHLVSEGRLYRVQGKGTFVSRPKIDIPLRLTSFTEDMRARGMTPGSRDLGRRLIPATAAVARELALEGGAPVYAIERLRTADGVPMALERSHIPAALAPDLMERTLEGVSLYEVLADVYGVVLDRGDQVIEAGIADSGDAGLLGLAPGSAVLLLQRRCWAGTTPAEYAVSTYRADRYQLRASLAMQ
ncbi:HTH-type transcriptional repressor YvoA [Virgisporangium aliadipatigenens]|uniref:HTH-type transcriptional repressor YvoA n=1 Tax=Virgisporangium aliadipatigenens TaxID=741659 RepID=A0A8J4DS14_9ACTN|nr:GntR family transcriptional regulator [Virgisporangium aliadipatigenens]GIJ47681.1 HTH-type transcriptional repressor YvoA [Virgisporangium aliadipatigenens]